MFRLLATTINILALVGLSILAKDKIIYYAHKYIPLSAAQNSQALPQPRDVEVAFSPNGGGTTTIVRALSQAKN
ncbi:MAG: hypothetical protein KC505_04415, partial [Myxococcales bacterium]|nr:hypothetical protein [Myxococcales bacterium]